MYFKKPVILELNVTTTVNACCPGYVEIGSDCEAVNCTIPDLPPYLKSVDELCNSGFYISYPSTCEFGCALGYNLKGNSSVACSSTGELTLPSCEIVNCSIPELPTQLESIDDNCSPGALISYNSTCDFVCAVGYDLIGDASPRCPASGVFTLPSCEIVNCTVPQLPSQLESVDENCNTGSIITYNSSCEFSCAVGFNLTGDSSVTCPASGELNLPSCEIVNCTVPQLPSQLESVDESCNTGSMITYNSSCEFSCAVGFNLTGDSSVTCPASGELNLPFCEIVNCTVPQLPSQLESVDESCNTGSIITYNSSCEFSCAVGFNLTGDSSVTCPASGELNLPFCEIVNCTVPQLPSQLESVDESCNTGSIITYNSSCEFSCAVGFNLTGDSRVTCPASGELNLPFCEIVNCTVPQLPSQLESVDESCNTGSIITYNLSCEFSCAVGFNLTGDSSVTCPASGELNLPSCEIVNCTVPQLPSQLESVDESCNTGSIITYNSSCEFSCAVGFNLTGDSRVTCPASGELKLPSCEIVNCTVPQLPSQLESVDESCNTGSMITYNSSCEFSCAVGFNLTGDSRVTCPASGELKLPSCEIVNCTVPQLPSQLESVDESCNTGSIISYNSSCEFSCAVGFNLTGDSSVTCPASDELKLPSCEIVNCTVPQLPSQLESVDESCNTGSIITYNSSCEFSCAVGFNLTGDFRVTCPASGELNLPSCEIVNCTVPQLPSQLESVDESCNTGSIITYNSSCEFSCAVGFNLTGDSRVTCPASGELNLPFCEIVNCTVPQLPSQLESVDESCNTGSIISYNSSCEFSCAVGFNLTGDSSVTCPASDELKLPSCEIVNCTVPQLPSQLESVDESCNTGYIITYNSSCEFSCAVGFNLTGDSSVTCPASGELNLPSCEIVNCTVPQLPSQLESVDESCNTGSMITYNSSCEFSCAVGFNLTGDSRVTCPASGELNLPSCEIVNCTVPQLPSQLESVDESCNTGSIITYNSSCEFSCAVGFNLTGDSSVTCPASGELNLPFCEIVNCTVPQLPSQLESVDESCNTGSIITYNSSCEFSCAVGFNLTGDSSVTCPASGELNLPFCEIVNCTVPQLPSQLESVDESCNTGSIITYNSSCEFSCAVGFNLTGDSRVTCPASGELNLPSCEIVNCTVPQLPSQLESVDESCNTGSIISYNSSCEFSCAVGFNLTGDSRVTCPASGELNLPSCEIVNCTVPQLPSQLESVDESCNTGYMITYNSSCEFSCAVGFNLTGDSSVTCPASGELKLPSCEIVNCTVPQLPSQLESVDESCNTGYIITYNSSCEFSCAVGFNLTGDFRVTCPASGELNLPSCEIVNCTVPQLPSQLESVDESCNTGSIISYNSSCEFSCAVGFNLTGDSRVTCPASDELKLPSCEIVNCTVPQLPSQLESVDESCNTGYIITYNSSCEFSCAVGFNLTEDSRVTCPASGELNLPICKIVNCTVPQLPSQLESVDENCNTGSMITYNSSCEFSCAVGFNLTGDSSFSCAVGFNLTGDSRVTCPASGELNLPSLITCTIPDLPANLETTASDCSLGSILEFGSTCEFTCAVGYNLVGESVGTCADTGAVDIPSCDAVTCTVPQLPSQLESSDPNCGEGSVLNFGSTCDYACAAGFRLNDSSVATCPMSGVLVLPACEELTCTVPELPSLLSSTDESCNSGSVINYNAICEFDCPVGHNMTGNPEITCPVSGMMSLPSCEIVTCTVPALSLGLESPTEACSQGSIVEYNTTCEFRCGAGYNLVGSSSVTCQASGDFTALPTCQVVTCTVGEFPAQLESPTTGCVSGGTVNFNTTCQFVCSVGYYLVGSSLVTCLSDGSLSLPSCQAVTCSFQPPTSPLQTSCDGGALRYPGSCSYTCSDGILQGNEYRFCQADGTLSGTDPTCEDATCSLPYFGRFLTSPTCTSGGQVAVGTTCELECEEGNLQGQATVTCNDDQTLSSTLPQCLEPCGAGFCTSNQFCNATQNSCNCAAGSRDEDGSCQDPCQGQCHVTTEICALPDNATEYACACRPGKTRDSSSGLCRDSIAFSGNFSLLRINGTDAVYTEAMSDHESEDFRSVADPVEQQLEVVYASYDPAPSDIRVTSLSNGSVVVEYELIFSSAGDEEWRNALEAALSQRVASNDGLLDASQGVYLIVDMESVDLRLQVVNECASDTLNDCSADAVCMDHQNLGGFTCQCVDGYLDLYPDVLPGRYCFPEFPYFVMIIMAAILVVTILLIVCFSMTWYQQQLKHRLNSINSSEQTFTKDLSNRRLSSPRKRDPPLKTLGMLCGSIWYDN
ncbi:sushi, von Willebrand factor type A, EGF and pentraxin domain-containing protein 1-like [Diadema antillarum]|uniref:sushi, von Willebrand factor type A, EGF and pentraxin domain-containing protein 1-like n=1 Tax=Diadema antillarum TaxID=105358 RepID=UPI003A86CFAB